MSITLDKQKPLPLYVAELKGGDTIVFESDPDRVFLVTDTARPNCRLLVDLVIGRVRSAHFTEPCIRVDVESTIVCDSLTD